VFHYGECLWYCVKWLNAPVTRPGLNTEMWNLGITKLATWICTKVKGSSHWPRHLYNLVNVSKQNTSVCKCHCLGIIVSRNKELTAQWWMWMLFSTEQGKQGLTHFRPMCEGDVWMMLGSKEWGTVSCEREEKLPGFPSKILLFKFYASRKLSCRAHHPLSFLINSSSINGWLCFFLGL